MWYPDNFLSSQNQNVASGTNAYNYIFYSNAIRIFYVTSTNTFYLQNAYETTPFNLPSGIINLYEWNKFIFMVSYNSSTLLYTITFYAQNRISGSNPIQTSQPTTSTNQSLQYIIFCHLDSANCLTNTNIYWSSGYYRNLKVWDGDFTSPWTISQFDQFFPFSISGVRPGNLLLYFPLNLSGLANNNLSDPSVSSNQVTVNSGNSLNPFNMPVYNYSSNFDYIQATSSQTNYVSSISSGCISFLIIAPSTGTCDQSCNRCWGTSNSNCYTNSIYSCANNYFQVESSCISNTLSTAAYVLITPTSGDLVFNTFTGMGSGFTITFYMKLFGLKNVPGTVINYSTNLRLYLSSVSSQYGLSLIYSNSGDNIVGTYSNFKNNMGQWTYISLSIYYNSLNSAKLPSMLNFQVDVNNVTIIPSMLSQIPNFGTYNFTIPKNSYGLWANIKIFNSYIVGMFGYELNSSFYNNYTPIATYIQYGTNLNPSCYNPLSSSFTGTVTCVYDYSNFFDSVNCRCTLNNFFTNTAVGTSCSTSNCSSCNDFFNYR